MKILMTSDAVGGVWPYAMELCAALEPDCQFLLANLGPAPSRAQQADAARLTNVQLRSRDLRLEWMPKAAQDMPASAEWLQELQEEFKPDLVHINGYAQAALPWRAPVIVMAHSCVLSWWRAVRGELPPARWHDYREHVIAGLQAADCVVTATRAFLEEISDLYGPPARARVIHNARRLRNPGARPAAEREPFIFMAGRLWDPAKNARALDTVAPAITWPLFVAGETTAPDGSQVSLYSAVALGRLSQEQVARWMGCASIYALPAFYEPFGLSVLEAASAGCALVLGDIPTLRESWEGAAIFVPPHDIAALRYALCELIAHPRQVRELSRRAQMRARMFSAASMGREYRRLYEELLFRRREERVGAGVKLPTIPKNKAGLGIVDNLTPAPTR